MPRTATRPVPLEYEPICTCVAVDAAAAGSNQPPAVVFGTTRNQLVTVDGHGKITCCVGLDGQPTAVQIAHTAHGKVYAVELGAGESVHMTAPCASAGLSLCVDRERGGRGGCGVPRKSFIIAVELGAGEREAVRGCSSNRAVVEQ